MPFGISPHMSCMPKFWHTYLILYGNFIVIVEPCMSDWFCSKEPISSVSMPVIGNTAMFGTSSGPYLIWESGLVGYGVPIRIRRFLVQTPLDTQLGLETQPCYEAPCER